MTARHSPRVARSVGGGRSSPAFASSNQPSERKSHEQYCGQHFGRAHGEQRGAASIPRSLGCREGADAGNQGHGRGVHRQAARDGRHHPGNGAHGIARFVAGADPRRGRSDARRSPHHRLTNPEIVCLPSGGVTAHNDKSQTARCEADNAASPAARGIRCRRLAGPVTQCRRRRGCAPAPFDPSISLLDLRGGFGRPGFPLLSGETWNCAARLSPALRLPAGGMASLTTSHPSAAAWNADTQDRRRTRTRTHNQEPGVRANEGGKLRASPVLKSATRRSSDRPALDTHRRAA